MKNIRKNAAMIAVITAMIASIGSMPASAVTEGTYVQYGESSLAAVTSVERFSGVMVETDGTALTAEMLADMDGYQEMMSWDAFCKDTAWGSITTSIVPQGGAYMIYTDSMDEESLTAFGRRLMLEQEAITAVYSVEQIVYNLAYASGEIILYTADPEQVLDESSIPELADCETTWNSGSVSYILDAEILDEDGFRDYYAEYQYRLAHANSILEAHSDILSGVNVVATILEGSGETGAAVASVWEGAGDVDADGTINSEDAAGVLIAASAVGSGGESGFSAAQSTAADINGDGVTNSEDAAEILQYTAAIGSGLEMTFEEFVK